MSNQIFGIFILSKANGTPYSWAFLNFHHVREFIKSTCNRNGNITTLGGEDFEPFTNLTAKWIPHLNLANYIQVIHIDVTKSKIKGSFPMRVLTWATSYPLWWQARSINYVRVGREDKLWAYFSDLRMRNQEAPDLLDLETSES